MTVARTSWLLLVLVPALPAHLGGQEPGWTPVSTAGIARAAGRVDSVFVDKLIPTSSVGGGDWVSYLAARLGALPIPEPSGIVVAVDTAAIRVRGRVTDLPAETRALFGPMLLLLDSTTTLEAEVVIGPSGPGVVKFVLTTIRVNGYRVPESVLEVFLAQVGHRYPELTETGRVLLVAIPPDGKVRLMPDAVVLSREEGARP